MKNRLTLVRSINGAYCIRFRHSLELSHYNR